MRALFRQLLFLGLSALLSWWFFLARSEEDQSQVVPPVEELLDVAVMPLLDSAPAEAQPVEPEQPAPAEPVVELVPPPKPEPEPEPPVEVEDPDEPPVAELGNAEGEGEDAVAETGEKVSPEQMMSDDQLLAEARSEWDGEARKGFATVLLATPEEQLDIAHYFGEELVLVPRSALDEARSDRRHYRVGPQGQVQSVAGLPSFDDFHEYRDLFDYEYARLPAPVRELRRSVLSRNEIYLFAALVPLREWALVVGRRREALIASGREASEVQRYVLEYERMPAGGFDLRVEEIVFVDETRFTPVDPVQRTQTP